VKAKKMGAFGVLRHPRAFFRFLGDGSAPLLPRLLALFAVLYVILPIDLVPDAIPVIGWLDDIGVVALILGFTAKRVAEYFEPKSLNA
jgi:uncharacterized membrane protein YkvA (DUF1232 family)